MNKFKRNFGALLLSVLAVTVLATSGASAHDTDSKHTEAAVDSSKATTSVATGSGDSSTSSTDSTDDKPTADATKVHVAEIKNEVQNELKAKRADQKTAKTLAARQKACTAREANLNKKIANYNTRATKALAKYDSVFTKLQAFQATENLTVPTYDALVTEANAKKDAATAAVNALAAVSVDIDCTSEDPAASVLTVKTAVETAKSSLKEYRTSVKNVLVALMTAKSGNDGEKNKSDDSDKKPATTNTSETN